jgi:hypothetical protein
MEKEIKLNSKMNAKYYLLMSLAAYVLGNAFPVYPPIQGMQTQDSAAICAGVNEKIAALDKRIDVNQAAQNGINTQLVTGLSDIKTELASIKSQLSKIPQKK